MPSLNAAQLANQRLRLIQARAAGAGPRAAAAAMSKAAVAATQVTLSRYSHPPGTPTPSPPGRPPATVTGQLRRSIKATPVVAAGRFRYVTSVGGTAIYARIQELGGEIRPVNAPWLRWSDSSGFHTASQVTIPARPYLRPTTAILIGSGTLTRVASAAWVATVLKP